MTVTKQILKDKTTTKKFDCGDVIPISPDLAMGTEIIFPMIHRFLKELGITKRSQFIGLNRIAFVNGHLVTTREAAVGTLVEFLDHFATNFQLKQYLQSGKDGPCQSLLSEFGMVGPGDLVIGSDQHITTYGAVSALSTGVGGADLASILATGKTWLKVPHSVNVELVGKLSEWVTPKDLALYILYQLRDEKLGGLAMEFSGDIAETLDIDARFTISNLMAEKGVVFAYFPPDSKTEEYVRHFGFQKEFPTIKKVSSKQYVKQWTIDLAKVPPLIVPPYHTTNAIPITELRESIDVNSVIIGTCTNGSLIDFKMITPILEHFGKREYVKLTLYPSCHRIIREMLDEGLGLKLTALGAQISPPTCQPCLGSGPSLLGDNEVGVYTTNRNFRGRHGSEGARVFLAGPLVSVAAAVTGKIIDPRKL